MTSTFFKLLCRNATNLCGVRSNVIVSMKGFAEAASSKKDILTVKEVRLKLLNWMGIKSGYNIVQTNRESLLKYLPKTQEELPPRTMQDSFTEAIIPLSTDLDLQDKYVSFLGQVRLGRLMEDMDMFAVWVASRHILLPKLEPNVPNPYVLVTILVEEVDFSDLIPKHNADIRLSGHVSWVGRSSLEIVVWLEQEYMGRWEKLTRAIFLMAARNATNTSSATINPLVAGTEYEKTILAGGKDRSLRRKKLSTSVLLTEIPTETELNVIHNIFLSTVSRKELIHHKVFLPPHSVRMKDAVTSNIIFCHPEDRNMHNKVFGGFLMRHALELSWTQAFLYGNLRPKLLHISDIGFFKAVDVGSLLKMVTQVIFTDSKYITVFVHAHVLDPSAETSTSNNFFYVYEMPQIVKNIIPETYHEAMLYLVGRSKFNQVMGKPE